MQNSAKHKIVILGCGNVAWHLAKQFKNFKKFQVFVYNHKANVLLNDFNKKLKCKTESSFSKIISDADFYFVCVADKFISATAKKIKTTNPNSIIVHTSGSMKIDELGKNENTAVFYPLQTFSKADEVIWKDVPIIIETKNLNVKNKISDLAGLFSKHISTLKYKERLKLHLAAVIVNNFTNALFVSAADLISQKLKIDQLSILLPLIKQTILKLEKMSPRSAQTGPAKRNDTVVMNKHLKLLSDNKELKNIYKQLSALIVKQQTKQ